MPEIVIDRPRTDAQWQAAKALCWAYRDFLLERSAEERQIVETFYPDAKYRQVMDSLPRDHPPPDGQVLLAMAGDTPAGCGMFHRFAPDACEWKRVYVPPQARGLGVGRALCERLVADSRAAGYDRVLLDTSRTLITARRLYERLGFVERDAYYDPPDIARPFLCFYELRL